MYDEVYTFYSQVASLDEAIRARALRGVNAQTRQVVMAAIQREHDAFVSTLSEPGYMVAKMKPHHERIQSWGKGRE